MKSLQLSAWAIADYARCPYQYHEKYHRARPVLDEPSPAQACGNNLHAALHALHREHAEAPQAVDAHQLLARHWDRRGFSDEEQEQMWFSTAEIALQRYLARLPAAPAPVLATERFMAARWKHNGLTCELTARVDRIDLREDGALEIIDYKATPSGRLLSPEALAADLVSYVYTLLSRVTYPGHEPVIVSHLNLFSLQKSSAELTPDQRAAQRAALLEVIDGVAAGTFPTRPGQWCAWCPAREGCPEFSQTVDPSHL